jgi:hypothetical protein
MKPFTPLIPSLFATATLALAEGIPVNRETGKVTVGHTVVSLSPEQVEETQTLGTFTLTPEQWSKVRAKSPQCPKRFDNIVPVTWNDCACGLEDGYVIALSRDRVAVLHSGKNAVSLESLRYELFQNSHIRLRMNERGEFHLNGKLIPFPTLLKALAAPPDDPKRNEDRYLLVELPTGEKPTDDVFESRLRKIAAAADRIGLLHYLFLDEDNA